MFKTVNLRANIPASHELKITLPNDIPTGPADVVVVISTSDQEKARTLKDLADSDFIGIWSDRADAGDDLARRLRQEGWKRSA
jgi:hypothetical protein